MKKSKIKVLLILLCFPFIFSGNAPQKSEVVRKIENMNQQMLEIIQNVRNEMD